VRIGGALEAIGTFLEAVESYKEASRTLMKRLGC
jgi:hypothetical protein